MNSERIGGQEQGTAALERNRGRDLTGNHWRPNRGEGIEFKSGENLASFPWVLTTPTHYFDAVSQRGWLTSSPPVLQ